MFPSRYFFKTTCTPDINKEQYVFRELTMDDELVPLYEGKIFVQLDRISWNMRVCLSDQLIIFVFSICNLFSVPGLFHGVRAPVFFCFFPLRWSLLLFFVSASRGIWIWLDTWRERTIVHQMIFCSVWREERIDQSGRHRWQARNDSSQADKDLFYFKQYHSQESTNRFCLHTYIGWVSIIWWQKRILKHTHKERTDNDQRETDRK